MNSAKNAPNPAKLTPNLGLKHRNSFGLDSEAQLAYEITCSDQLPALTKELEDKKLEWRVLGGGSNVILPKSLPGATLLINILGQEILRADDNNSWISVGAGVNWHEFVAWTLDHNLPGLENLALIPGTVGAAPIQNIGAYGVEIGEYIDSIEAFDSAAHAFVTLPQEACQFAYRDSYFKQNPNRFIVTKVVFKIPKAWQARLQYADLAKQFAELKTSPSAQQIFDAVCTIRSNKLPDPKVIGNAGSFFQNPIVSTEYCEQLSKQFPDLVSYPDSNDKRKLAAGWLIDQCGFKGKRVGPVGVYEKQALVLVNHGGGTSTDILNLAKSIQEEVLGKFGVQLEIEPNIL
ncbi:MAG: UDP-N-acetylenolpyruvoylglucosamine reductase [Polynucleobacter sp. 24-46-87]|jgi:UDP-N-acetylmuramate dehydrogenase|uniref:UDP-N-acetylmuramate dehydrogenase n=1 Tax=unclassified Polynucleobacter TaxID=2640945 RepID=UPI000BD9F450|nr:MULTISPECIES: UDP-N-acetylmuramate dehydrogenase [unclassified Polynucleobacter]OYY17224.1 MAG: UDP-N-acetylenolpyruvoylglucosamine reductase [Polynucleobacter sp. 35-46-11]OZA15971.1 MAG: UDP-N-acetylenolpyruvoylglucosamine reductase [Polynucleobacter sp. 24-46-87]OZA78266.1 MAG: UDP-N-acetylenolpyruvoylglucosamine reductase [Polynucleobacter sp. 39-46-10]